MKLHGVLPVIQMPYDERGDLDVETLRKLVDWLFAHEVDGVAIGLASEIMRQSDAERDRFTAEVVRAARGRGPVVAHAGAESARLAVRHAKAAQDAGAAGLMVTPPCLTACDEAGIEAYYEALAEATAIPIVVQDASGYQGQPIPIELQARLFKRFPERMMFKPEALPLGPKLSALRDATGGGAPIFEGLGGLGLVDAHHRGIVGTMPGSVAPWALVKLWRALNAGNLEEARRLHRPLVSIIALYPNLDAFLAVDKRQLVRQGLFKNDLVRGPVGYCMDAETAAEFDALFDELKRICDAR
ncbi:MAG: dihydrodipicolinate synthase family protein [Planctomycetota bacterium]|nr:dihydrodipicolinate synthase family protein [Planctomycetota bacterium]